MPKANEELRHDPETNRKEIWAAQFAVKAHAYCNGEILGDATAGNDSIQEILHIDLTEAPEDAVCSLVIDLIAYCEQQKIDWDDDVMSRAFQYLESGGVNAG